MYLAEKYFKLFEGNKRAYGVVDLDDNIRLIDPDSCKIVTSKMKLGTYLYASAQLFEVRKRYYK